MALAQCEECGGGVSEYAGRCPHCGGVPEGFGKRMVVVLVLAVVVYFLITEVL